MKKCLNSVFLSLLFCFGLFMGFGSIDVFASSPTDAYTFSSFTGTASRFYSDTNYVSYDFVFTSDSPSFLVFSADYFYSFSIGQSANYSNNYVWTNNGNTYDPVTTSFSGSKVGSVLINGVSYDLFGADLQTSRFQTNYFSVGYYGDMHYDFPYLISSATSKTAFINDVIAFINDNGSSSITIGGYIPLSYDSSLGYIKNISNSNETLTFTNGGKDWTNVISYDKFTSTNFDLLTPGAKVEYFFQFGGYYGSNFGLGSPITMDSYLSDSFSTEGLSFSYTSTLWRELYDNWCLANNLGSTDRVKNAYLTLWLRPVYDNKYGDWVKVKEDGSSYLITSSQPFEGTETPNDANTSLGGQSNVSNTQNGNSVNTYEQISSGDIDYSEIQKSVKGLSSLIGDIPSMISTLFSWLPNWVITFLASCIALWGVIALIKLIRG